MTRRLTSGSSCARALACPASEALPRVEGEAGEAAERGTAIHAFLAAGRDKRDEALAVTPEKWRATCAAIDLDAIPQTDAGAWAAEVAFAYDVETGRARELGRDLGRNYGELGENEIPVTVDAVALVGSDEVAVADHKSGRNRVTAAVDNPQLLLGALAACRAYGRSSASVSVVYVREDRAPWSDAGSVDEWALDAFGERLRLGAARIRFARQQVAEGITPDVAEGDHCRYCPAFRACPAKVALVHAVTSAPNTWRDDARAALTPAKAADALRRLKVAKSALHMVEVELQAYASEVGGVDMGDGEVYGPRRTVRESVIGPIVHGVLTQLHGRDIADRAVTFESTKSAIKDALRKVAQDTGGKFAPLEKAALEAIRAANGVTEKVSVTVDVHRPKKEIER